MGKENLLLCPDQNGTLTKTVPALTQGAFKKIPLPIFLARWHSSKITAPSKESAPHQSIICCSRARSTFLLPTRWLAKNAVVCA